MKMIQKQKMPKKTKLVKSFLQPSEGATIDIKEELFQKPIYFYQRFINEQKFINSVIDKVSKMYEIRTKHSVYAVYEISVLTEDVFFTTRKRYTEFKKLYDEVCRFVKVQTSFPPKTFLYSGADQAVIQTRLGKLNEFLAEMKVLSKQIDIGKIFFQFLQIKDNYDFRSIDIFSHIPPKFNDYYGCSADYIDLQIVKINSHIKSAIQSFMKISQIILQVKPKIQIQTIRAIFLGSKDKLGVLEFSIKNDNDLITIEGLKLIQRLLNPQHNLHCQRYKKIFRTVPITFLKPINQTLFQNSNFKQIHCKLIKIYLQDKQNKQILLKEIYNSNTGIYTNYQAWDKFQSSGEISTSRGLRHSGSCSGFFKLSKSQDKQQSQSTKFAKLMKQVNQEVIQQQKIEQRASQFLLNRYQIVNSLIIGKQQYALSIKSQQCEFFRIEVVHQGQFDLIRENIEQFKCNGFLDGFKFMRNQNEAQIEIFSEAKTKHLKFKILVEKSQDYFHQILIPANLSLGSSSFYKFSSIKVLDNNLLRLRIVYLLIGNSIKQLFQEELNGEINANFDDSLKAFHNK